MKKLLPSIFLIFSFMVMTITYMVFNGQELSASKSKKELEKYTIYENLFQKISLKTTKGNEFKLSEHKDKVVILNFWASWCQPCLSEFKSLKEIVNKYPKDKLLVLGINNDEETPLKNISRIEKKMNLNFESVVDKNSQLAADFYISVIPASIAFYNGKVIHYVNKGFDFTQRNFVEKLDKYLSKSR